MVKKIRFPKISFNDYFSHSVKKERSVIDYEGLLVENSKDIEKHSLKKIHRRSKIQQTQQRQKLQEEGILL